MDIRITHVIELAPALMSLIPTGMENAAPERRTAEPTPKTERRTAETIPVQKIKTPSAASAEIGEVVETSDASDEIDAHGWPWSEDMHAATRSKTKDGLWRMKVGVNRPEPLPGFPKTDGSTSTGSTTGSESSANSAAATGDAGPATSGEDDDEFAAFRAAAAKSDADDAAAKAGVPARKWTDADLGSLCNQAAVKLGDPSPVKEIIASFVPQGEVAHSRNIPEDKREEFAKAVEAKAGIEFAG